MSSQIGYVVTKKGVIALSDEGVICVEPITDEKPLEIALFTHYKTESEFGTAFEVFPSLIVKISLSELLTFPTKEVTLQEFVRSFGNRLEYNYGVCERELAKANRTPRKVAA